MSRLTINVTDRQHQTLKALAALEGKTIKEYAIERLFPSDAHKEEALGELKGLIQQRIAQVERDGVDTRSFTESAEAVPKSDTRGG